MSNIQRYKCGCYNCTDERASDGEWVMFADHAAEVKRLEDDVLRMNDLGCELRQRAERAEAYVAGQDVRSDFRTAAEMRAALELAQAELARVEWERDAALKDFELLCQSDLVSHNALLRAECEAWRAVEAEANKQQSWPAAVYIHADNIGAAKAATDAAGILKGEAQ